MNTNYDAEPASVQADNMKRQRVERICSISKSLSFWLTEDGTMAVDTPGKLQEMNKQEVVKVMNFFLEAIQGRVVHPTDKNVRLK